MSKHNEKAGRKTCLFHGDVAKIRSIARQDDCSKIGVEEVLAIVRERDNRQPSIFEFIIYYNIFYYSNIRICRILLIL